MKFPSIAYFPGVFQISNNQLILSQRVDYETEPIVIIQVESTDNGIPPLSVQVCLIKTLHENLSFSLKVTADLVTFTEKFLMENFISCAVKVIWKNVPSFINLAFPF